MPFTNLDLNSDVKTFFMDVVTGETGHGDKLDGSSSPVKTYSITDLGCPLLEGF